MRTQERAPDSSRSVGELVATVSRETSSLVRDELRLAGLEMKQKGAAAGVGAGMLGGAGLFAGLALVCLVAAAVLGLATVWPGWLAALVVAAALLAVAGTVAVLGKRRLAAAVPPVPHDALQGVKLDLDALHPHHGTHA